jgi:predicted nucleic acid-binding protein
MAEMNATAYQFVDSNILVYAYEVGNNKKHEQAVALLESLWESKLGCLSIQVLQEFYVNVTRKTDSPLSPEQAAQVIQDFSVWSVHRPGVKDVLAAIELHIRFQVSFWDALILRSAQQLGCSLLWSEDFSDGQDYGGVTTRNPFKN